MSTKRFLGGMVEVVVHDRNVPIPNRGLVPEITRIEKVIYFFVSLIAIAVGLALLGTSCSAPKTNPLGIIALALMGLILVLGGCWFVSYLRKVSIKD